MFWAERSKKEFGSNPHKGLFGIVQGGLFNNLREKNLSNWLLYTQHDFLKKLSEGTLKKDYFFNYLKSSFLSLVCSFYKLVYIQVFRITVY